MLDCRCRALGDGVIRITLYTTEGCHLCDQAEALLRAQQALRGISWQAVDIAGDDALFERYGIRIPVLRRDDGAELGWPFDTAMLEQYLAE